MRERTSNAKRMEEAEGQVQREPRAGDPRRFNCRCFSSEVDRCGERCAGPASLRPTGQPPSQRALRSTKLYAGTTHIVFHY